MSCNKIELIQLEEKTLRFTVRDKVTKALIDVSDTECSFEIKVSLGAKEKLAEKDDTSFDKSQGANGILRLALKDNDLNWYGEAYGILTIVFDSNNTDKSIYKFELTQSKADE
ncbi:MAG: hypothetical protein JW924_03335 [Fusobacteriaceae bacterium]|nr:hypothetical protein [Fusobacteriaceae bacterium]